MYTVAFGNFTLTLTTTELAPKSFVNNSSLTLRYCVIARLLYAKINPALFYDVNKRASVYIFNNSRHTAGEEKDV